MLKVNLKIRVVDFVANIIGLESKGYIEVMLTGVNGHTH
jgi:hypothetical protein